MEELFQKHRRKGVVVDANILLLFVVGTVDRSLIPRFKRTNHFTPEDYDLLDAVLRRFDRVITTPNILTEVSNLAGQLSGTAKIAVFAGLANMIAALDGRLEPSRELAASAIFGRFGLTDSAVDTLAKSGSLILTDDFRLSQYLASVGSDVVNFNHLRDFP